MNLRMLYRPGGEGARAVEQYVNDFERQNPTSKLELVDVDSPAGSQIAQLYGLTVYPVILATSEDGSLIRLWQGEHLPLFSELSSLAA